MQKVNKLQVIKGNCSLNTNLPAGRVSGFGEPVADVQSKVEAVEMSA